MHCALRLADPPGHTSRVSEVNMSKIEDKDKRRFEVDKPGLAFREPVKTATLQNGHNQNGHTEWDHYQNGHTTLVKTATLLWSKRPHRMGSYQNGHVFLVKTATPLWSKRPQGGLYPKWAEVATKTATLHLVKTATNSEWYQFCEEWITECVCVTPQNVHNFIVLNWLISVS